MNFDELFEMMNDTLKKYIETKEDIQNNITEIFGKHFN